ncbi:hypothetical protein [Candidatus Cyanaurora vandensis]|uniref:hypothetical protein n=1 Tax=Candidatus Cyanaurora vandensis TaxID=2714958 RepID=UPI00257C825F|nr:hypothetical protein [Candidatus Cyanaurora vandensis]
MQTRIYQSPGIQPDGLAELLAAWFTGHGFETQYLRTAPDCFMVQGYQNDLWRSVLGVAAALTVEVKTLGPDQIAVRVGAGAWVDKILVASLGVLFFLPLALTAAWGTWQQSQLDKEVWATIEQGLPTAVERVVPMLGFGVPKATTPLPTDWFNPDTGEVYSTRFFERMASWQTAIADGVIESAELEQQNRLVLELLMQLEGSLEDEAHHRLGEVFAELAVLQGMQSYALVANLGPKS